jgi:hypothetical protein
VLVAVSELVGYNIEHNVYFKQFPEGIPDTMEFWTELIIDALHDPARQPQVALTCHFV